jgi:hypothetical protein
MGDSEQNNNSTEAKLFTNKRTKAGRTPSLFKRGDDIRHHRSVVSWGKADHHCMIKILLSTHSSSIKIKPRPDLPYQILSYKTDCDNIQTTTITMAYIQMQTQLS